MIDIIPGILEKDFKHVKRRLDRLSAVVPWVHIDVSDGEFTPYETWQNPDDLTSLPVGGEQVSGRPHIEVHFMIARPWETVSSWLHTKAERFIFHVEAFERKAEHLEYALHVINEVHEVRKQVLFGLKLETPVHELEHHISALDGVLVMAHKVGVSGEAFEPQVLEKVVELRDLYPEVAVEVDGGVNTETIVSAKTAGANRAVVTSYLNSFAHPEEGIRALRKAMGDPARDVTKM